MDMMTPSYIVFFSGGGEGFSIPELVTFLQLIKNAYNCIDLVLAIHRYTSMDSNIFTER